MSGQQFYVLTFWRDQTFNLRYAYGSTEPPVNMDFTKYHERCPVCGIGLGQALWLPPQNLALIGRKSYPDFLYVPFGMAMSARAIACYRDAGLTGLIHIGSPLTIVRVGKKKPEELEIQPPEYREVHRTFMGGDLDCVASGAVRRKREKPCAKCGASLDSVERIALVPGSWNGSDIFSVFGERGAVLVTERFREMILANKLTNYSLIPAEEFSFDFRNVNVDIPSYFNPAWETG